MCFSDIRRKILKDFEETLVKSKNSLNIEDFSMSEVKMTQFFLDPTSMNLTSRVHIDDPIVPELFNLTRDLCFAICKRRSNMLNEMKTKKESEIRHEKSLREMP